MAQTGDAALPACLSGREAPDDDETRLRRVLERNQVLREAPREQEAAPRRLLEAGRRG